MVEHRIYETKTDINTLNTRRFYDSRAKSLDRMECPYTAVLLGDQNPQYAKEWHHFEMEHILPQLGLNTASCVIDIGCGIGRWAESIIPHVRYYYGVDFSKEMIEVAKQRCVFYTHNYDFFNYSFQETVTQPDIISHVKFNVVIISGVCMYINDGDLRECFEGLSRLLDEHCLLYLEETVAIEKRLTLDECPSEALKTNYDVIYRTPSEYNTYYQLLLDAGFHIVQQGYLPHLNKEKTFSETERWYTILKR